MKVAEKKIFTMCSYFPIAAGILLLEALNNVKAYTISYLGCT
jgi:hypothetical protein